MSKKSATLLKRINKLKSELTRLQKEHLAAVSDEQDLHVGDVVIPNSGYNKGKRCRVARVEIWFDNNLSITVNPPRKDGGWSNTFTWIGRDFVKAKKDD